MQFRIRERNLENFVQMPVCWYRYSSISTILYSYTGTGLRRQATQKAVLWIRIRMDPELWSGSGSGIIVPDLDPAKSERACK